MKRHFFGMILMTFLLLCLSGGRAAPDLGLQDASVRSGSWKDVYAGILTERSADIRAYQDYVFRIAGMSPCHPVELRDLTGDGVPELLFLELEDDTEYGFQVGRLWIYTPDVRGVHCALTLQPEIDDMLYSRYYLSTTGMLTIHFSDTERGWILQLRLDLSGHYTAENTLIEEADFSGEGPDDYYMNGKKISLRKYQSMTAQVRADQGAMIGSLMVDDGGSGFTYTLEEALEALASGIIDGYNAESSLSPLGSLPELYFSKGSFAAGQKLAVYSAPSDRSWRSAKGKAAITSGSEIFVAGTEDGWILILYELNSGVTRAGYINSQRITGEYTSGDVLLFSPTKMTLTEGTVMTDDPIRQKTTIGKLKKGSQVICLAKYRGWIYVETKVSGKTARGFIASSSLSMQD